MLALLVPPTTDPAAVHPALVDHQADMIRRCPYLGPSVQRGLTVWSAYRAEPGDQPDLLALLVHWAEELRTARREAGPLVCRNIAVIGPADLDAARRLMDWPAWLARNLYAPVRLMVGRFWVGVQLDDSTGEPMMPPPVSFFSLRAAVPHRDGVCELGAWLTPDAQGRGLVTRAFHHMIDWAFRERGMHRVELRASPANPRGCNIAARLGMTREGVLHGAFVLGGIRHDSHPPRQRGVVGARARMAATSRRDVLNSDRWPG